MKLTRYEQETIINFNAQDQMATLYTRDPVVMRKVDVLVTEYLDIFKCIGETDIDKTYEMPKKYVTYSHPRRCSDKTIVERQVSEKPISILNLFCVRCIIVSSY